jgi:hypothetical protein
MSRCNVTTKRKRETVVISVLYNTKTKKFLGRRGKWVSCPEFEKDPPQEQTDVITPDESQHVDDPDPSIIQKCIGGVLHYCIGNVCAPVPGPDGGPIQC